MRKKFLFLNLTMLFFLSCNVNGRIDEELSVDSELVSNPLTNRTIHDTNYVTPIIFESNYNPAENGNDPCYGYKVYVASDVLSTKNRVAYVQFLKSNSLVEYKTLTIPAGSYVSQTVPVFVNKPQTYGNVLMKINALKIDNILTNEYNLNAIETVVSNCNTSTPTLPGPDDSCLDKNNNGIRDCDEVNESIIQN